MGAIEMARTNKNRMKKRMLGPGIMAKLKI